MFAAAIYPPLLSALASGRSARTRHLAVGAGCIVALLVGVSRVVLATHSVSEVLAGWLAGGLVSVAVVGRGMSVPARLDVIIVAVAALWMTLMPAAAPTFDTHALVTRMALQLSGHERPYTRRALLARRGDAAAR